VSLRASGPRRACALVLTLLLSGLLPARAAELRDTIGVAHAGGKYGFTEEDYLNEGADRLLELGTRVIKVWFQRDAAELYPFHSEWGEPADDYVELAQKPYYKRLFGKPFSTYILVVPPVRAGTPFLDGLSDDEREAEEEGFYELTRYLLERYAHTGKTFVLQNWEGDHLLRQGLLKDADPDPIRIQGMRDWWDARQAGVDRARREVGMHGVTVAHAAEVNLLAEAIEGRVTALNNVIPFTHCDLYSYSSWDLEFDRHRLVQALDYLKSMAPDSELYGEDNIYLGEYGVVRDQVGAGVSLRNTIEGLTETALGWGVRWAVFWQVFSNEAAHVYTGRPQNADLRGFWLIRPDGTQAPTWQDLHRRLWGTIAQATFTSFSGQFLASDDGGEDLVTADRWRPGPFSSFAITDLNGGALRSGDPVTIQAHNGFYLEAEDGGGGAVYARAFEDGPDETFTIWKAEGGIGPIGSGDAVAFQTRSGHYLVAEGPSGVIHANRVGIGPWETFHIGLRR
jgi:hypothetical protein